MDEHYLVGVVSVPGGVFNPYSGVKTSLLWFDRALAKRTDKLLFVKVENDGFDLGAQRRPIAQNDLPEAFRLMMEYKRALYTNTDWEAPSSWVKKAVAISKIEIARSNEYSLSSERYLGSVVQATSAWPLVDLGEVSEIRMGETLIKGDLTGTGRPIYSAGVGNEPWAYSDNTRLSFSRNTIVIGARGTIGAPKWPNREDFTSTQTTIAVTVNEKAVSTAYV